MTDQKKRKINEPMQSSFESLPLDEKIANLFKMEAVTLSETFAYAVKSPLEVVEKVGDVITDIGQKIEAEAKKAWHAANAKTEARPEAQAKGAPKSGPKGPPKAKGKSTKRPPDTV